VEQSSEQTSRVSRGPSLTVHADRGPTLPREPRWQRGRQVITAIYLSRAATIRLLIMVATFAVALFAFIVLLLGPTAHLVAGNDIQGLHGTQRVNALNGIRQTLVAAAAGFAAAVGLTFTARTYALSKRAQEVDRFTKAVSLLASDKQSERIGGLLTIEYVVRERTTEARAGVEVICAFIRERSPVTSASYVAASCSTCDGRTSTSTARRSPLPARQRLSQASGSTGRPRAGGHGSYLSMTRLWPSCASARPTRPPSN
jgi:hypothetical protein